jgi:riboflavin biosynthesis pyrimidine reductase
MQEYPLQMYNVAGRISFRRPTTQYDYHSRPDGEPAMNRPYVICHMCVTIDGKIMGQRWLDLPGGKALRNLFEPTAARFGIGAWIVGTTTMKEFSGRPMPLRKPKTPVPAGDFIANPKAKKLAIGVDAKAVLRVQDSEVDGDHVVLLITNQASPAYRSHLRDAGVSYLICGATKVDLPRALQKLHKAFSLRKLMAQGGGKFNGSMLKAGLIDEISLITVPISDGGGPSIAGFVDADKPLAHATARLRETHHQKLPGGAHWYRYRVKY